MASRDRKVSLTRKQSPAPAAPHDLESAHDSNDLFSNADDPITAAGVTDGYNATTSASPSTRSVSAAAAAAKRVRNLSALAKQSNQEQQQHPPAVQTTAPTKASAPTIIATKKLSMRLKSGRKAHGLLTATKLRRVVRRPSSGAATPLIDVAALRNGSQRSVRNRNLSLKKKESEETASVLEEVAAPIDEQQNVAGEGSSRNRSRRPRKSGIDVAESVKTTPRRSVGAAANRRKVIKDEPAEQENEEEQQVVQDEASSVDGMGDDESVLAVVKQEDIKQEVPENAEVKDKEAVPAPDIIVGITSADILERVMTKENFENKFDVMHSKIIDMLDLNVPRSLAKRIELSKRRHSIEKFSLHPTDAAGTIFTGGGGDLRSMSPRIRRLSKARKSTDLVAGAPPTRRSSPYSTRSESHVRILRNRKLNNVALNGGGAAVTVGGVGGRISADKSRKRRRLCSDLSGSEASLSKLSGYESESSSLSDLTSLHGSEIADDSIKSADTIKKELMETYENNPPDNAAPTAIIKRSLSTENTTSSTASVDKQPPLIITIDVDDTTTATTNVQDNAAVDTNSNVCDAKVDVTVAVEQQVVAVVMTTKDDGDDAMSFKVPDTETSAKTSAEEPTISSGEPSEIEKRKTRSAVNKNKSVDDEQSQTSATLVDSAADADISISTEKFYGKANTATAEVVATKVDESAEVTPMVQEEEEPTLIEDDEDEPLRIYDERELQQPMQDEQPVTTEKTDAETPTSPAAIIEETPLASPSQENLASKEDILLALGLQSLQAAKEAKQRKHETGTANGAMVQSAIPGPSGAMGSTYTGTLKTVIKLSRERSKKYRNPLKITLQKNRSRNENEPASMEDDEYKIMKEKASGSWKSNTTGHSSDTAGAQRKTHYSNRSNMDGSSEHTSDGDTNATEDTGAKLVIPEKASSFSIHPGRLCKDECSYCFGKFGMFDTPCHIAQMKCIDRQNKILASEKHLTRDSCLCDACYRHVDRKANMPSYSGKSAKRGAQVAPGPRQNHCHVLGCGMEAYNILKRKWIIKMRKAVCQLINIDLDNPGLHSIPVCEQHYHAVEHLLVCNMCKRRLARNHIHQLGENYTELNSKLNELSIPVALSEKPIVCKMCKYFATLLLQEEEKIESAESFLNEYRKRLLHFHNVEVMNEEERDGPHTSPFCEKNEGGQPKHKRRRLQQQQLQQSQQPGNKQQGSSDPETQAPSTTPPSVAPSTGNNSRSESPSDYMVDYQNLIPAINLETGSDQEKEPTPTLPAISIGVVKRAPHQPQQASLLRKSLPTSLTRTAITNNLNNLKTSDVAVKRLNSNTSISVRQLFPGEEDLPLNANIEFGNVRERTPQGWEKCVSTIQFDGETKQLWQDLQKPYGNQSSFLRHLILLEKYFRNGDLVLSPNASHHSSNYTESVNNRLRAYDNIATGSSTSITAAQTAAPRTTVAPTPTTAVAVSIQGTPVMPTLQLIPFAKTSGGAVTITSASGPTSAHSGQSSLPPQLVSVVTSALTSLAKKSHQSHREPPLLVNAANIPKSTPISLAHIVSAQSPNIGASVTAALLPVETASSVAAAATPSSAGSLPPLTTISTATSSAQLNACTTITASGMSTIGASTTLAAASKTKLPPALISLQPGTNKPMGQLVRPTPPSQKIKFPITKNWRPTLIPIDQSKKIDKRTGLVQVISGGKPYHITIEDYKKMCAIKRTFDLRQKRLQEQKMGGGTTQQSVANTSMSSSSTTTITNTTPTGESMRNVNGRSRNSAGGQKVVTPKTPLTKNMADDVVMETVTPENSGSLAKLDKHVESINPQAPSSGSCSNPLPMPRIPKSLTVIPQTVVRKLETSANGSVIPPSLSKSAAATMRMS